MVSKWDCYLEEVESVPSITYEVETVVSVPEELQDGEPMSRQRQCKLQAWPIAISGNGVGAEKVKDLPP